MGGNIGLIVGVFLVTVALTIILFNLKSPGKRIEHDIIPKGDLASIEIQRSIGQLLGPPLAQGNSIRAFHNGDQIFPAMLEEISKAEKTITFETFIYWSGDIGKRFSAALIKRAQAHVKIHIILDWIGSRQLDEQSINQMKKAGIQVCRYRPLHWYNMMRVNNRTHRKLLIIDGKIGFTGGVGIADQWSGHTQDENHWRDSHFRLEGPSVAQLQAAFMDNWSAVHTEVLHGDEYFPPLIESGDSHAQVFKSSPEEGSGSVRLMYLYSIAHAKKSIQIASAYFVPDSHVRSELVKAQLRGVQVEVILPGEKIDSAITRHASRAVWGNLLKSGVRIYRYQPTMFHCKYMIVDKIWVSVGSTNFDNRSFRLNDESNLNIIDPTWAPTMSEVFEKDKSVSQEYTLEHWKQRSLLSKLLDYLAHQLRSQV